jgi:hypothetical protein
MEHRLRVFESRVLRRVFGPMRADVTPAGEDCVMKIFMICTKHQVFFEICGLLSYYTASCGNYLPYPSVLSSSFVTGFLSCLES